MKRIHLGMCNCLLSDLVKCPWIIPQLYDQHFLGILEILPVTNPLHNRFFYGFTRRVSAELEQSSNKANSYHLPTSLGPMKYGIDKVNCTCPPLLLWIYKYHRLGICIGTHIEYYGIYWICLMRSFGIDQQYPHSRVTIICLIHFRRTVIKYCRIAKILSLGFRLSMGLF